jgi:predicted Zn-dependent peptidase
MRDAFGPNYKDPIGNIENIQRADIEHLKYFRDTYYKGKNIFISIAGDLTELQALRVINKYDEWSPRRCKARKKLKFKFNSDNFMTMKPGIEQVYVNWISPMKAYNRVREEIALDIGMDLLYNYLYEEVVWKKGLCYGVYPEDFNDIEDCEALVVSVPCSADKVEEVIDEIPKALMSFLEEEMTKEKIEESRLAYLRSTLENAEDTDMVTRWMADSYMGNHTKDPFDETFRGIERIKDHTIRGIMTEVLTSDRKLSVMVGDDERGIDL